MDFSINEIKILKTLWKADRPLSRREILELTPDNEWSAQLLHFLINSLLKKGAIVELERENCFIREYRPLIPCAEYCIGMIEPIARRLDFAAFLRALILKSEPNIETLHAIEQQISLKGEREKE